VRNVSIGIGRLALRELKIRTGREGERSKDKCEAACSELDAISVHIT